MKKSIIKKIISIRLAFLLFLSLTACGSGGGSGPAPSGFLLENWQWLRPLPSGNSLYGITHANDDYVAVGAAGSIYTSSDGLVKSGTQLGLSSVAYGNGTYLAVGSDGTVLSSSTGTEWTIHGQIDSTINSYYAGIVFGKNTFVVVSGGNIYTSQGNSVSWTKQYSSSMSLTKVYFENNQFIATTDGEKIITSPDGIIWTERSIPNWSFNFNSLCFGQGKYVASNSFGGVYTSTDAETWTAGASIGDGIFGMAYGKGLFVAVGGIQSELGSI